MEALDGEEGDEEADRRGGGIWWGKRRGSGVGAADYFGHFFWAIDVRDVVVDCGDYFT